MQLHGLSRIALARVVASNGQGIRSLFATENVMPPAPIWKKGNDMQMQSGENVLYEMTPARKILWVWSCSRCVLASIIGAFACFWAVGFFGGFALFGRDKGNIVIATASIAAAVGGVVFFIGAFAYSVFTRRTYRYYITDQRCVFTGGILIRIKHSIPYHKITDIEVSQNIIERAVGLSSVNIYTPSSSGAQTKSPEIRFSGLKDSETPASLILSAIKKVKATGE